MNPVVDTIMLIGFVLFMIAIFGGYNRSRMQDKIQEEEEGK